MGRLGVRGFRSVAVLTSVLALSGCDEVTSAVDGVERAGDKASVCAEALGIVDLDVNVDPERVAAEAEEKARELRGLGEEVADQSVRDTLFAMADGYLELERNKIDYLSDFSGWLRRNLENVDRLRQACL